MEPSLQEIRSVKNNVNIPVLAGSGITKENVRKYYEYCDAFIIGSYFKKEGKWFNTIDIERVKGLLEKIK